MKDRLEPERTLFERMFLYFLQEGHFQTDRSADLLEVHGIRTIGVEQEQSMEFFRISRFDRYVRALSSVEVN